MKEMKSRRILENESDRSTVSILSVEC